MSIEEINIWKIDFEVSLMTLITQLNQSGVPYNTIRDLIEISVNNCIKRYDKNRDLLTTAFKKLSKENKEITEISINESNINNNDIIGSNYGIFTKEEIDNIKPEIRDENYGFIVENNNDLEKDDINNNEIITKINECEYDKFPLNCISRDYLEKDDIMLCFILHKETRKSRL